MMPRAGATGAAGLDYFALMRRQTLGGVVCVRAHEASQLQNGRLTVRFLTPPVVLTMLRVSALVLVAVAVAADFRVKFEVEVPSGAKEFTVLVHEDWAPIGAALCGM